MAKALLFALLVVCALSYTGATETKVGALAKRDAVSKSIKYTSGVSQRELASMFVPWRLPMPQELDGLNARLQWHQADMTRQRRMARLRRWKRKQRIRRLAARRRRQRAAAKRRAAAARRARRLAARRRAEWKAAQRRLARLRAQMKAQHLAAKKRLAALAKIRREKEIAHAKKMAALRAAERARRLAARRRENAAREARRRKRLAWLRKQKAKREAARRRWLAKLAAIKAAQKRAAAAAARRRAAERRRREAERRRRAAEKAKRERERRSKWRPDRWARFGKPTFVFNGWRFYQRRVKGFINSRRIRATCKAAGLLTPCDHPAYADGRCVTIMKRNHHFSHPRHTDIDEDFVENSYWYCGRANRGKALLNTGNTHRWTSGQHNGKIFCVAPPKTPRRAVNKWNGWVFYKVLVPGRATSRNIRKACKRLRLRTPCDHTSYYDGKCVVVNKRDGRHMSYSRHHDFDTEVIDRTIWYAGRAGGGYPLQNWRNTHRWANGRGDRWMTAMCVRRARQDYSSKKVAFTYHGWKFYKFRMKGRVNSRNIYKTCKSKGLVTICDHQAYKDGKCQVIMKRNVHFSYNRHHAFDRDVLDKTWWYCGRANGGKALQNWFNSHRWSTGQRDGDVICGKYPRVNPRKRVAVWNGWDFYKVNVIGKATSWNIYKTCKKYGMKTPCDHTSYYDGRCVVVNKRDGRHMSYSRHHDFPRRIIDRTVWYCGRHGNGWALQNWRNTHRWCNIGDLHEVAMCVKRHKKNYNSGEVAFTLNGWKFYKHRIRGRVNSRNIYRTCQRAKQVTVCDHPAYKDGRCSTVMKRNVHFSYNPHHAIARDVVDRSWWYCGRANGGKALQNWFNSHRWSTGQMHGDTFCAVPPKYNPRKRVATWNGWEFYKVNVKGVANSDNIAKACRKFGYEIPCDHSSYYDGVCVTVGKWDGRHMSYNRHHDFPRRVIDRTVWYCGRANGGKALMNWRNTHRWTDIGDRHTATMCVKRAGRSHDPNKVLFTYHGWRFYRRRINGRVNSENIHETCKNAKMMTLCDHVAYADGKCAAVMKRRLHFSYDRHHNFCRNCLESAWFYCGGANGGRALQNKGNSHRWSRGQKHGDTICVRPPVAPGKNKVLLTWRGWKWYKLRVNGPINAHNIWQTCKDAGMKTPCDHSSYNDGRCVTIIHGRHMSYNRHHNFPRGIIDRTYWYTGRHGRGALQNWRNTHRWTANGDMNELTMCIKPAN